jgi:hypothetical protein
MLGGVLSTALRAGWMAGSLRGAERLRGSEGAGADARRCGDSIDNVAEVLDDLVPQRSPGGCSAGV